MSNRITVRTIPDATHVQRERAHQRRSRDVRRSQDSQAQTTTAPHDTCHAHLMTIIATGARRVLAH